MHPSPTDLHGFLGQKRGKVRNVRHLALFRLLGSRETVKTTTFITTLIDPLGWPDFFALFALFRTFFAKRLPRASPGRPGRPGRLQGFEASD